MNSKFKKGFFNKKNLIIIGSVLFVLLIIILFLISDGKNEIKEEKITINCSFERQLPLMSVNIKMEVDYVNEEFKYVKEEYKFNLSDEKLINEIDTLKQEFEKKLSQEFNSYEAKYSVEKEQDSIILKFEMNNEVYEKYNKNSKNLTGDESLNYSEYYYGAESLEQYIMGLDGECYYE